MLRRLFLLLLFAGVLATIGAWIISVEMAQNWVFARSGTQESLLDARAALWLIRCAAPALSIACGLSLRRWNRTEPALFALARDIDPAYARAFDKARMSGVETLAWTCDLTRQQIKLAQSVPIEP